MVQFRTSNNLCRRCHGDYDGPPQAPTLVMVDAQALLARRMDVGQACKWRRREIGISQSQLAQRMAVPRTYVSKIETGTTTPTLASLKRLAKGLCITLTAFLDATERGRWQQIRELVEDGFVVQVLPFLPKLDAPMLARVLTCCRELSEQQRRAM